MRKSLSVLLLIIALSCTSPSATAQSLWGTGAVAYPMQSVLPDWSQIWQQSPPRSLSPAALKVMPDGGYVQLTQAYGVGNAFSTPTLVRYQADGTRLWVVPDPATQSSDFCRTALDVWPDGSMVVAYFNMNEVPTLVVRKLGGTHGELLWERRHAVSLDDGGSCRNFAMARNSASGAVALALNSQSDALILRYAHDGMPLPELRAVPPPGGVAMPQAISFTQSQGIVLGYEITAPQAGYVYRTIGLGVDGLLAFSHDYFGPAGRIGNASWVKVDPDGNIYVLMTPESPSGGHGLHLQKLSRVGIKLWGFTLFQPINGGPPQEMDATPKGLLLNQAGAPLLLYVGSPVMDTRLAQLNADGTLRWQRKYVGENPDGSPLPTDFAVADSGHIRVVSMRNNPTVAELVEWNAHGALCGAAAFSFHGTALQPSHIVASDSGWAIAGYLWMQNAGALALLHFPKIAPCWTELIFADAMEAPSQF